MQLTQHAPTFGLVIIAAGVELNGARLIAVGEQVGVGQIGHRISKVGFGVEQAGSWTIVTHAAGRIVANLHETVVGTIARRRIIIALAPYRTMDERLGNIIEARILSDPGA